MPLFFHPFRSAAYAAACPWSDAEDALAAATISAKDVKALQKAIADATQNGAREGCEAMTAASKAIDKLTPKPEKK